MPKDPAPHGDSDLESQVSNGTSNLYADRIVVYRRVGVWDWYEEKDPDGAHLMLPSGWYKQYSDFAESFQYVIRGVKDLLGIPGCKVQFAIYMATGVAAALIPAATIWSQGSILRMMDDMNRTSSTIDKNQLLLACAGRIACTIATTVLQHIRRKASLKLDRRIQRWHARKSFVARARLDVPTVSLRTTQKALSGLSTSGHSMMWQSLQMSIEIFSNGVRLVTQALALLDVLRGNSEERLLTWMALAAESLTAFVQFRPRSNIACAGTTKNSDYNRAKGWEVVVQSPKHRKELVAGNLAEYAISEYTRAVDRLGDDGRSWNDLYRELHGAPSHLRTFNTWVVAHLTEIAFTVRAMQNPARLPEFMARLNLVQTSAKTVVFSLSGLLNSRDIVRGNMDILRRAYEAGNIRNVVPDGTIPFQVESAQLTSGIALEFRNVSFTYPDAQKPALQHVSFTLRPGQLCVIVGTNGAGKSTVLKLAVRLYDPDEGQIFLGGQDIRTLKLSDVRQAMSVLFQDYTHFPLSIRDNITLGDPSKAHDDAHIREAARLGGADSFIEKLPEGFDTYLKRVVGDFVSGPEEGNKTRSGKPFDVCAVRHAAGIKTSTLSELSGGQMQRLAVSRMFMRSVIADDKRVGLLLFDEPSASLDPAAEHDLFNKLRELRGNKTMVFSSHRFGNLTRHADVILYMNESSIVESGTHEELLRGQGEYAKLWQMQAQAFVS